MKVHIDIDCSPAEARAFLGLPDLRPLQEAVLKDLQDRLTAAVAGMDPEALLKAWMPIGLEGLEQMQKAFWAGFAGRGGGKGPDSKT